MFVCLSFFSCSLVVPQMLVGPVAYIGNTGSCSVYLQENGCIEGMGSKGTSPFFSCLGNAAGGRFVLDRPVLYQRNLVQQLPLGMLFLHASLQVTQKCEFRVYIHIYIYIKSCFIYICVNLYNVCIFFVCLIYEWDLGHTFLCPNSVPKQSNKLCAWSEPWWVKASAVAKGHP